MDIIIPNVYVQLQQDLASSQPDVAGKASSGRIDVNLFIVRFPHFLSLCFLFAQAVRFFIR